jgi:hypothetical protein
MISDKTLIEELQKIEKTELLELLENPKLWKSVDIDYHPPRVERLWCQLGQHRLYLHFIHPCKKGKSLFHPHPWPSVIHVLEGEYEMGVGFGSGLEEPPIFSTIVSQGSMYYDMPHKDGWHYVRPTKEICTSIMLAGKPWGRQIPASDEVGILEELSNERIHQILSYFKTKLTT